jgi:hypothetical protein
MFLIGGTVEIMIAIFLFGGFLLAVLVVGVDVFIVGLVASFRYMNSF